MTRVSNENRGKKKVSAKQSSKQPRFIVLNNAQQKMLPYDIASQHTMTTHGIYPQVPTMHGGPPMHGAGGYDGAMVPVMPHPGGQGNCHKMPMQYGQAQMPYSCQICEAQMHRDPVSWSRLLDHIINLFVMPFEGMLRCSTTGFKACLSSCDTLGRVTENAMLGCNAFCEKGLIQCERSVNNKLAPHSTRGCPLHGDSSLKSLGPHSGTMMGHHPSSMMGGMQHTPFPPQYMQPMQMQHSPHHLHQTPMNQQYYNGMR